MGILTSIEDLQRQIDSIKESIAAKVRELPDNPRIQRLGDGCFLIHRADIGQNWTPQHHDFRVQYERIIVEVNKLPISQIPGFFKRVIEEGKIRETGGHYFTFHNDVRIFLKSLV
jgi:hypothetical protein